MLHSRTYIRVLQLYITEGDVVYWLFIHSSLVPRPLLDFILQPWRKIGRRPGIKTTSRTGNGGLGQYVTWTRFVLTKSTISGPWCSFDPRSSPDFSPRLQDNIWEGPGNEATYITLMTLSLSTGMAASNMSKIVNLKDVSFSTRKHLVQLEFITLCAACVRQTRYSLSSTNCPWVQYSSGIWTCMMLLPWFCKQYGWVNSWCNWMWSIEFWSNQIYDHMYSNCRDSLVNIFHCHDNHKFADMHPMHRNHI